MSKTYEGYEIKVTVPAADYLDGAIHGEIDGEVLNEAATRELFRAEMARLIQESYPGADIDVIFSVEYGRSSVRVASDTTDSESVESLQREIEEEFEYQSFTPDFSDEAFWVYDKAE